MKLSAAEVIAVPQEPLFAELADFEALLARANSRYLKVEPVLLEGGLHTTPRSWTIEAIFHGMHRSGSAYLQELSPPGGYRIAGQVDGISSLFSVVLEPLGADRTRVKVGLELRPLSITGRVMIQSMRLMKTTLSDRLKDRLRGYARGLETKHNQGV